MKRFLSQNRISNEIIEYLQENSFDILARILPSQGLFTYPVTIVYGTGVFSLSVSPSGAIEGTDGEGHVLSLSLARQINIPFEDDGTNTYWIGMKYIEIPNDIYDNPRTGKPEYDKMMEEIGELDEPYSVTDAGGGTITLNVNTIFESGVDHSGRSVRVWLINPLSGDPTVAFEDCTVAYSSPNNTITTTGSLGQGTISTLTSDYNVACLGVSVRESATNPFSSEYIIIGNIDSSQTAPAGTDTGDQVDFSGGGGHTLQKAYDGVGSGAGRTVTVNNNAIQLRQETASAYDKDVGHAVIRARKDLDKTTFALGNIARNSEVAFDARMRIGSRGSFCSYINIHDVSGTKLNPEEAIEVTTAGSTLSFTRGGTLDLNLTSLNFQLWAAVDMVEITGSTVGNDGLYIINTVASSSTLTLYDLVGGTASLAQEIGNSSLKASIYRPVFRATESLGVTQMFGIQDILEDGSFNSQGLVYNAPENTPDADVVVEYYRYSTPTRKVRILGNADITTDGDITSQENISTVGDFILTSTGDYTYSGGRSFSKTIHPWDGKPAGSNWARGGVAAGTRSTMTLTSAVEELYYTFRIPPGFELVSVDVMINDGGTDTQTIYLKEIDPTWSGTEAAGSPADLISGGVSSSNSGVETVTATPDSTELIDGEHIYELIVDGNVSTGTVSIFGLKLNIEVVDAAF
jgi:hypothetical protein